MYFNSVFSFFAWSLALTFCINTTFEKKKKKTQATCPLRKADRQKKYDIKKKRD